MNIVRRNFANLNPEVPKRVEKQLKLDFDRFAEGGLPDPLEPYLLDTYGLDVTTTYGGIPIKNPWGKASGQLSMTTQQVQEDADAGLGFCVLKTVIARDAAGRQSMSAWAVPESRMKLERITGKNGAQGWTVSWRGRGWHRSFEDYLKLVTEARQIGDVARMLIIPSCKYFLPTANRPNWETDEYRFSTDKLIHAYTANARLHVPMPLEKDFSPTLAGSSMAVEQRQILEWLQRVPSLIRDAVGPSRIRVGLKLFNALFDDEFQLAMLQAVASAGSKRPDFVVYANRLFDPERELDGQRGIAVGGPDLSARNLRVLTAFKKWIQNQPSVPPLELSATGDICSGRRAVEYLLGGCRNFQLHTFFQLPTSEYHMRRGSKIARALHRLYFDPQHGFIRWALHAAAQLGFDLARPVRLLELAQFNTRHEVAGNSGLR